ncbi:MAG: methyltransferase domain-containing protein, partial [Planctomycetota bacterium]|nr:methyltransferase domain-containing protein [Planctomycetota bacterium]
MATGKVEIGPYVQFTGPYTAVVRWDTGNANNSVIQYGTTTSLGTTLQDPTPSTVHEVIIGNLEWKTKYYYRVNDGDGGFTSPYWFDNSINYTTIDCSAAASPYTADSLTAAYEAAANRIINQTGIKNGYCLVYGCGEGRLAFELAKRSELTIIGVDEDINKINTATEKLMEAGVYGARVKLRHVSSLSSLPFTKYFANLIVSERMISDGSCPGSALEMFRVLRPSGGIAYLGQPSGCTNVLTQNELESWLDAGSLSYTTTNDPNSVWSKVIRAPLAGSGWWSHQYGTPQTSGNSFDTMPGISGSGDMELQWIGRPGADSALDRHVRMPAPVTANGRIYHQGLNRIMAMDSYNGAMLWSLEIPHLRRVNMPRDASNVCADDDAVYVAVKDACWRIDGDTGLRTLTHKLNDLGHDWGCVFRYGDKLYGSAVIEGACFTKYWDTVPEVGAYHYDAYPERSYSLGYDACAV